MEKIRNAMKKNGKKRLEEGGFTLIELMVVLAILAVLMAIAIPTFANIVETSKGKADQVTMSTVQTAIEVYKADIGSDIVADDYASLVQTLITGSYLKDIKVEEGEEKYQAQAQGKKFTYDPSTKTIIYDKSS